MAGCLEELVTRTGWHLESCQSQVLISATFSRSERVGELVCRSCNARVYRKKVGELFHRLTCPDTTKTFKYNEYLSHSAVLEVEKCTSCGEKRVIGRA